MKKGLLFIAHGSPSTAANTEFLTLSDRVRESKPNLLVAPCFLEGKPSISDAIDNLVKRQAKEIIVLPYFLVAGKHIVTDVPTMIELKRKQYPEVKMEILPHIGAAGTLLPVILGLIQP